MILRSIFKDVIELRRELVIISLDAAMIGS
jgi:hypothetical protein